MSGGSDQQQIERVLSRIPAAQWASFLDGEADQRLRNRLLAVDDAISETTAARARPLPTSVRVARTLGYAVMQDPQAGPWIRERLLRTASARTWTRLVDVYGELQSRRKAVVRRGSAQGGRAPRAMAAYWHQGGVWAQTFCSTFGLPDGVWQRHRAPEVMDEEVIPSEALPALHDFQMQAYQKLRTALLARARGRTAMLSMPTGAGKTRVVVEAICDHLATASDTQPRTVLWIAHSAELQLQAWECFREVWQVAPDRLQGSAPKRVQPLRLVRLWGGRDPDSISDEPDCPEVLIASVDQLYSWLWQRPAVISRLRDRRLACAVIDEAHGVITGQFRYVLDAFGLRRENRWRPSPRAPLLVGMTATPWRASTVQDAALRGFFSQHLITPRALGKHPVKDLQRRKVLSQVTSEKLHVHDSPRLNEAHRRHIEQFHEIPPAYLEQLARSGLRNSHILRFLLRLPRSCKTLVFACSIEHAQTLAACLNQLAGPSRAVSVTFATSRAERALSIEQFRSRRDPQFLCTVSVLAAGFDAPQVGAVVITRPTMSAALYEQMVGRGLRGPKNGGTPNCLIVDVQDGSLPEGVLSYERVVDRWK